MAKGFFLFSCWGGSGICWYVRFSISRFLFLGFCDVGIGCVTFCCKSLRNLVSNSSFCGFWWYGYSTLRWKFQNLCVKVFILEGLVMGMELLYKSSRNFVLNSLIYGVWWCGSGLFWIVLQGLECSYWFCALMVLQNLHKLLHFFLWLCCCFSTS